MGHITVVAEADAAELKKAGTGFWKYQVFTMARYTLTNSVAFQHGQESCFLGARPSAPLPPMGTHGSLGRGQPREENPLPEEKVSGAGSLDANPGIPRQARLTRQALYGLMRRGPKHYFVNFPGTESTDHLPHCLRTTNSRDVSKGEKSPTPSHQGPGERQNPIARRARAFLGRKCTVCLSGDRLLRHTEPQKDTRAPPQEAQIREELSCQLSGRGTAVRCHLCKKPQKATGQDPSCHLHIHPFQEGA